MSEQATGPVTVYGVTWCPWCVKARELLKARGVAFEDIDLTNDAAELARVKAEKNWPTVPIVLAGETVIGGFSDLASLDARTQLAHLK